MSIQAINWAFGATIGNSSAKLVLIALSNYANENGECWPSQKKLGEITCLSERAIRYNLNILVDDRWILTEREQPLKNSKFKGNLYTLNFARKERDPAAYSAGGKAFPPAEYAGTPAALGAGGKAFPPAEYAGTPAALGAGDQRHLVPVEPLKENHQERTITFEARLTPLEVESEFSKIWSNYPNPVGKSAALRHFTKTVKTYGDIFRIQAALEKYKTIRASENSARVKHGQLPINWQNGSTWFNDWESWADREVDRSAGLSDFYDTEAPKDEFVR